jgi:hypothetical protein
MIIVVLYVISMNPIKVGVNTRINSNIGLQMPSKTL